MSHPLINRLEQHGSLTEEEKQVLRKITAHVENFRPGEEIVPEGSTPDYSSLILEGFATRQKHLVDGRRQISMFFVPGDFSDLHSFLLKKIDDGVGALTSCRVALVPHRDLKEITKQFPYVTRALWLTTLIDGAIHRQWITTLGRMDARERLAHFLCELRDRLETTDLLKDHSYELPITQEELGDAFGLTTVHVNRVLQELRRDGLITSRGKAVTINDWERLKHVGHYSSDYLHADQQIERD